MSLEIIYGNMANMWTDAVVRVSAPGTATRTGAGGKLEGMAAGSCRIEPALAPLGPLVVHIAAPAGAEDLGKGKALLERGCLNALRAAYEAGGRSVAVPLVRSADLRLSDGLYLDAVISAADTFLDEAGMEILLVASPAQLSEAVVSALGVMQDFVENVLDPWDPWGPPPSALGRLAAGTSILEDASGPAFPAPSAPARAASRPYDSLLASLDAGFSESLLALIDRSGRSDAEIYKKAHVSRQHFSKIRSRRDYRPTKATAVAFALALELGPEEARDLVARAGYSLTRSSAFDVLVMHFIESGMYDIGEVNEVLYVYDQPLLGS